MKVLFCLLLITILSVKGMLYETEDYKITFEGNYTLTKQLVNDGYVNQFAVNHETRPYNVIITVLKSAGITKEAVFSSDYKESFLKGCNCTIVSEEERRINNYDFLVYTIKYKSGIGVGYSSTTVNKGRLFSVVSLFNSIEPSNKKINDEMLNSIFFK